MAIAHLPIDQWPLINGHGSMAIDQWPKGPGLGTSRALKYRKYQQNLRFWNSHPMRRIEADSAEVVSKTLAQTPPPTHAGGQDDGSYTNSLKLTRCLGYAKL